jgi:hypothetical protein
MVTAGFDVQNSPDVENDFPLGPSRSERRRARAGWLFGEAFFRLENAGPSFLKSRSDFLTWFNPR